MTTIFLPSYFCVAIASKKEFMFFTSALGTVLNSCMAQVSTAVVRGRAYAAESDRTCGGE